MGTAGTGTVVKFGTPRYTAYPYRGVMGIHGLNICQRSVCLSIIFVITSYLLFDIATFCNFQAEFRFCLLSIIALSHFKCASSSLSPIQLQGAHQLMCPCSLGGPRCTIRA